MAKETEPRAPWDEAAALEELERVRRGIEEWRGRRKAVQAEFDRFVQGFRAPAREVTIAEPPVPMPGTDSPVVQSPIAVSKAPVIVVPPPEPVISANARDEDAEEPVAAPVPSVLEPTTAPPTPMPPAVNTPSAHYRFGQRPLLIFVGALVAVAVVAALLTRPWQSAPSGSAGPAPATPSARPNLQPAVPADGQRATSAVAGPSRSEILAVRRVWVRVVVDGVKAVERELQAGERVPLPAGATAAIRAGNAAAVQVTINGENRGTLGAEGEVVTRTLRIPAAPVR